MKKKWIEHRVFYMSKGSRHYVPGGMGKLTRMQARKMAADYELKGYGKAIPMRVECKGRAV